MNKKKKAVSPVISTVLLIMIVLILALIILIWAMGFVKESITKTIHNEEKRANEYCLDIKLESFLNDDGSFGFENNGNVPIPDFNVKITRLNTGKSETTKVSKPVNPGFTVMIDNSVISGINHNDYEKIKIIPSVLGKKKDGSTTPFECPEKSGIEIK